MLALSGVWDPELWESTLSPLCEQAGVFCLFIFCFGFSFFFLCQFTEHQERSQINFPRAYLEVSKILESRGKQMLT